MGGTPNRRALLLAALAGGGLAALGAHLGARWGDARLGAAAGGAVFALGSAWMMFADRAPTPVAGGDVDAAILERMAAERERRLREDRPRDDVQEASPDLLIHGCPYRGHPSCPGQYVPGPFDMIARGGGLAGRS